jgi:hypothetical protein
MPYIFKHRRPPESWHEFRKQAKHPLLIPYYASEFAAEWIVYFLSRWSFLELLEYAGSFSILLAVIFYFAESGERTQARHYQAWQVINTAQGKGGSGGRIDALAALNEDHVALVGVDVSDAFLQGIRLENADLRRSNLRAADLKGAHASGANMEFANLQFANLRDSDLRHVVLSNANLQDVDLVGADLTGADLNGAVLDRADLRNADLSGIVNWQNNTSIEGGLIHGVRNAPGGFVEWAVRNKAIDQEPPASQPATRP